MHLFNQRLKLKSYGIMEHSWAWFKRTILKDISWNSLRDCTVIKVTVTSDDCKGDFFVDVNNRNWTVDAKRSAIGCDFYGNVTGTQSAPGQTPEGRHYHLLTAGNGVFTIASSLFLSPWFDGLSIILIWWNIGLGFFSRAT